MIAANSVSAILALSTCRYSRGVHYNKRRKNRRKKKTKKKEEEEEEGKKKKKIKRSAT